jgi:pyruvate/2-oxoglutarate dehydrogenase complex dihydrolipoamide acyltransferase (E2) component
VATEVKIPKLGLTMEEGTVAAWLVADGTAVSTGQSLYLLETDKVETEVEAEADGVLSQGVPEGTTLAPGAVVGWLLAQGEMPPVGVAGARYTAPLSAAAHAAAAATDAVAPLGAPASGARLLASPNARRVAALMAVDLAVVTGSGPGGRIVSEDVERFAAQQAANDAAPTGTTAAADTQPDTTPPVSPLVRRLAERHGVELSSVTGTGAGGRITRADIAAAAAPASEPSPAATRSGPEDVRVVPIRGMRRLIGERMWGSLQDMAQLTLGMDVEMDEAVALREYLAEEWAPEGLDIPGYTDLVIKASALALIEHPRLNAVVHDEHIELQDRVDVGFAVAVDDGLVVPVVRNADTLPLGRLAGETKRLSAAARSGGLQLTDLEGGTFSVTSLGMYGVDFFTPVVNPPNVAILGVGRIRDEVRWTDKGRPRPARRMTLSLTFDHRAVDGAPAAEFAGTVKDLLEHPQRLLAS